MDTKSLDRVTESKKAARVFYILVIWVIICLHAKPFPGYSVAGTYTNNLFRIMEGIGAFVEKYPQVLKAFSTQNQSEMLIFYGFPEYERTNSYYETRLSPSQIAFYITEYGIWLGLLLDDSLYYEDEKRLNVIRQKLESQAKGKLFGSPKLNMLPFTNSRQKILIGYMLDCGNSRLFVVNTVHQPNEEYYFSVYLKTL
jgi:hypothetical protein